MLTVRRRGQAVVEFLPAVLIFMLIMTAAMAYFRTLRQATFRQEVVRNLAFAKIANSGTLTTPGEQLAQTAPNFAGVRSGELFVQRTPAGERQVAGLTAQGNPFISSASTCFQVLPHEATTESDLSGIYALPEAIQIRFTTMSVVYRGALNRRVGPLCDP